jgi:hypothetical protein
MGLARTVRTHTTADVALGSEEGARPSHLVRRFPTNGSPVNNRVRGHCGT